MKTSSSGTMATVTFPDINMAEIFGMVLKGYIKVEKKGIYTFSTKSNDGSMFYVHNKLVANNDGSHGVRKRLGQIILAPGFHPVKVIYFQMGGGKTLEDFVESPGIKKHQITPEELFH